MLKTKLFYFFLIPCTLFIRDISAQNLEVDGGAKINTLATDNSAAKLVALQLDGTLVAREASSLGGGGGGLSGIEKIIANTIAETVNDGAFANEITAFCTVGKFVIGGTCSDSNNALSEWSQGGSGTTSQYTNPAFGRAYSCRSRNSSGSTQNNLVVTATAICATIP